MSDAKRSDTQVRDELERRGQAEALAASLDEAADDLDRNGPVSADELRRGLLAVFAELRGDVGTR